MYRTFFKRIMDFLLAFIGLIFLSPIFFIVWVGLLVANAGKPFFYQDRPGRHGRVFRIIKFRTMNDKTDGNGNLLSDNERLTQVGKLVRKTSLDEIPQLLNVLNGDMSLIGPRPLRVEYLPIYNEAQSRRHEVRPGITGWAQVNGRNTISWTKKFEYDVWYVDNLSLLLDLKIIFMTVIKVIKANDINVSETIITEKFNGHN